MKTRGSTYLWLLVAAIAVAVFVSIPFVVQRIRFDRLVQEVKTSQAALPKLGVGDTLSPLFHAVAEIVRPAVVVVQVTQRIKETQAVSSGMRDFWQHLFGGNAGKALPPVYQYIYGLVVHDSCTSGYKRLSLIRASFVRNCQWTPR